MSNPVEVSAFSIGAPPVRSRAVALVRAVDPEPAPELPVAAVTPVVESPVVDTETPLKDEAIGDTISADITAAEFEPEELESSVIIVPPAVTKTARAEKRKPVSVETSSPKINVTYSFPQDTVKRMRATFVATRLEYEDETLASFVELAVLAECARREKKSNGGNRFAGGDKRLPGGRSIV